MAKHDHKLTQAMLKQIFHYDPETGQFTRRSNGKPAGCVVSSRPRLLYRRVGISIAGEHLRFYEHRLAHLWMTGEWPLMIDHINGDGTDNRWSNLRECCNQTNQWNMRLPRTNTSGHIGVHLDRGRWRVMMCRPNGGRHIGCYVTFEEAVAARIAAEINDRGVTCPR